MICKVGLRRTVKGTAICGFELRTPIGPCTIVFTATQCIQESNGFSSTGQKCPKCTDARSRPHGCGLQRTSSAVVIVVGLVVVVELVRVKAKPLYPHHNYIF